MSKDAEARWIRLLSAGAAALVVGLGLMSRVINGQLTYPLDDPYIEMSVARNLAEHGVWGLRGDEFASASSSPLWTLLLGAVYRIAGPGDWTPLILNALAAGLCVLAAAALLAACGVRGITRVAALLAVIALAPLGPIGLTGMEHVAHSAATLAFVSLAARVLDRGATDHAGRRRAWLAIAVCIGATVMTGLRFEGLFMGAGAVLLLLLQRRWLLAAAVAASAWLPVAAYAWFSTSHGSMWLPNPIAIKGNLGAMGSPGSAVAALIGKWVTRTFLVRGSAVLLLTGTAALALARLTKARRHSPGPPEYAATIFIVGALLHLQLAGLGWFFRYEMYLVALGVVVVAPHLGALVSTFRHPRGMLRRDALAVAVLALTTLALLARAGEAHRRTPRATREVAMQPVQMARFLARYYDGRAVAVNDIGAISWYADVRLLDLWGLANIETAHLLMRGVLDGPAIVRMAVDRSVAIAFVYDDVLGERNPDGTVTPPPGWTKVATWTLASNVVVGSSEVCAYSVAPGEEPPLREHLRAFARELPAEVRVTETPARTVTTVTIPHPDESRGRDAPGWPPPGVVVEHPVSVLHACAG